MSTVTIEEAQARLLEIIHRMRPGEEVVIIEDDQPIARIVPAEPIAKREPRQPGTLRDTVLFMAPDFDAPLEDLKDYS
ncbi:MAG: type II toxin-antitoxin system Phd/YefM family antitoxin [Blastocatellia bacterium]